MHWFGRHDHRFTAGQHCRARCRFGIARAQMLASSGEWRVACLAASFGGSGSKPASILGDADGHDFIFALVDGIDYGRGGKQRHFVFSATPAEQDPNSQFVHDIFSLDGRAALRQSYDGTGC